ASPPLPTPLETLSHPICPSRHNSIATCTSHPPSHTVSETISPPASAIVDTHPPLSLARPLTGPTPSAPSSPAENLTAYIPPLLRSGNARSTPSTPSLSPHSMPPSSLAHDIPSHTSASAPI